MPQNPATYTLTPALIAAHAGSGVLCLAKAGEGRSYRLHAERPGAQFNRRVPGRRADLPSGAAHRIEPVEASPALIEVFISGPLETRAGYYQQTDVCGGGWTDGHDAIRERLCAAFEEGDVLLVVDSPGGAAAGLPEAVDVALKAKARYGRRVTAIPEYMIGSAATWWTLALADELYVTVGSDVGSIGARGEHRSFAGALAQAGEAVEYFCWPNDGKVAWAPDLPTTDTTRMRGNRDVKIAGEAFAAAVCAGPVGQRYGLTPEILASYSADMFIGESAVERGLADGVATKEDVIAYALTLAESGARDIEETAAAQVRAAQRMAAPRARARRAA
ncbi:MAG TPA: hypothetical protein VLT47_10850 [Anaeromyxobacteraceae bacterium]|nr:hypothetical protein [Anaeromyxobacteraceae bacterium]